jgi:Flp pilus assembly protein TadG
MRYDRSKAASSPRRLLSDIQRFARDESGTTAVEFGIIALPFTALLIGMMMVCIYYFKVLEVENAVYQAARDLRVGNLQQGLGAYNGLSGDALKDAFKQSICNRMSNPADCFTNIRVMVQSSSAFSSATEPSCKDGSGNLISNSAANSGFNAGGASSVVVVTGCYQWDFGGPMPFLTGGSLANGAYLIQASSAARTEPYN